MAATDLADEQLKWFEAGGGAPSLRRMPGAVPGRTMLRHDHLVLFVMGLLVAGSVVFALGVERGKRLVRAEQAMDVIARTGRIAAEVPVEQPERPETKRPSAPSEDVKASTTAPAPTRPRISPPTNVAASNGFAVQVVTYSQPQMAQRELQQLQRRGEKAFLLQRQGKTALLVGPFESRQHAADKQSSLRTLYRDCFIKNL